MYCLFATNVFTQVHTEVLSRYPGLVSQVAPLMKILKTCIGNGPPHPESLAELLHVSPFNLHALTHLFTFFNFVPEILLSVGVF